jgi:hypothetical protein
VTELADRLHRVQEQIARAARAADRDPAGITLIVVTKFQPLPLIEELFSLGVRDFGESRHPEARDKAATLPDATWHFIGQLQTNKARQVAKYASAIHSVDRPELVDALAGQDVDVLVQVDLAARGGASRDAPSRGGARPGEVPGLAQRVLDADGLRLAGVMTVAPIGIPVVPAFAALRMVADRVRGIAPDATWISAGMSGDFAEAIASGATHVRIGSAVTGPRSTPL